MSSTRSRAGGDRRERFATTPLAVLAIAMLGMLIHGNADAEPSARLSATSVLPGNAVVPRLLAAPSGVRAAADDPVQALTLRVDARVEPARVRVRQQVLLTARVISTTPANGRLHAPRIHGAKILPLGEDRRVESARGGDIQVYEQRFSIFPNAPGTLSIAPLRFDAWRLAGGAPITFESDALSIQVDPAAAPIAQRAAADTENADLHWLPARELTLVEAGPSTVRIAPGQTLERMIMLRADGLMAEDLPAIPVSIPFQLRLRDDAPRVWNERTANGVIGYRSERILIGAAEDGVYELPGASIDWWNSTTETWEQATLPAWTLTVAAFASAHRRPAATWNLPPLAPQDGQASSSASPASTAASRLLQTLVTQGQAWLGGLLAIIGLILLWLYTRRRRQERGRTEITAPSGRQSAAQREPDWTTAPVSQRLATSVRPANRAATEPSSNPAQPDPDPFSTPLSTPLSTQAKP